MSEIKKTKPKCAVCKKSEEDGFHSGRTLIGFNDLKQAVYTKPVLGSHVFDPLSGETKMSNESLEQPWEGPKQVQAVSNLSRVNQKILEGKE